MTTRDLLIADVLRWLDVSALPQLERITLDTLEPEDAARIARASPALGVLITRVANNLIPGGLLVLELLHDARVPDAVLAATPATEGDLLDVWWSHVVVGHDVDRHARLAVARAAAEHVVSAAGGLFQLPNVLDGAAISALEVDGVLVLDRQYDRYRFGHDIIQDWAIVRWVDGEGAGAGAHVTALAQVPGFYRCVALFAKRLAEREPQRYDAFLRQLEDTGDTRGVQAFLSALALSPQAAGLLDARADMLLENGAARLAHLLNVLRTEQVDVNVSAVDFARGRGMDLGTAIFAGLMFGTPRHLVWAAALRFSVAHIDALGRATLPFVTMADRWQQTTPTGFPLRAELFAATMRILAQLEPWQQREASPTAIAILYDDQDEIEKTARSAIAHAADVDPAAIARYLLDLREQGYGDAQEDMLKHAGALGTTLTDEVVDFVVAVLTEDDPRDPWEHDSSELGLRRNYFPASDMQGPFLALLRSNEAAGLAVVRRLTARAVRRYERDVARVEYGQEPVHLRPLSFSFRGRTVTLRGDDRAYTWFRPGAHDSSVLTSALMALDTWTLECVRNGRDPGEIADLLLTDTDAIAFLGIVVALAYDAPALVSELVDVVGQPWIWRLELARANLDWTPDDMSAFLPAEFRFPTFQPELRDRNRERDAGRSRSRHPVRFSATYLFTSDDSDDALRQQFVDRAAAAQLTDACLWVEEQAHVDESVGAYEVFETFQAFTNPDNYEVAGNNVQFRPPQSMQRSPEEQQFEVVRLAMLAIGLKAANALRDYSAPDINIADFERVGRAVEAELIADRFTGDDVRRARDAVVRFAGVTVTFGPKAQLPASDWAANIVRDAARAQAAVDWSPDREDGNALDERIGVAVTLGALLAAEPEDEELRGFVLRAAAKGPMNVGAGLLQGLTPAWVTRPHLALNVFFLLIEAALRDGNGCVPDDVVAAYAAAERAGTMGPVPDVTACSVTAMYRMERVLPALPKTFDQAETVDVLVGFAQRLLAIAQADETDEDRQFRFSFAWQVARFAANLFVALPPNGDDAFRASVTNWQASLDVFGEAVLSVIRDHIGYYEISEKVVQRFCALAEPFLDADHRGELDREHLWSSFQKACWALMFCGEFGGMILLADWPHAARFAEHIGSWVRAVGGHPSTASALVAFLDRFSRAFTTTQLVEWIATAAAGTSARRRGDFWRRNGEAIGALLLRLRNERPDDFRDAALRTAAAGIADHLVTAGVTVAGEVRRAFEHGTCTE
jgi:hypothetical protein